MSQQAYSVTMFDGSGGSYDGTLAAGESKTSRIIDVNSIRPLGHFASQLMVSGDGTVKVEILLSIDGTNFYAYDTLFEDQTVLTAPEASGGVIENHAFAVCTKFRVRITETSGADSAVVKHYIGVQ